jgi:hypothetical protein
MNYAPTRTTEAYSHVVRLNATAVGRASTSLPAVIERVALFAMLCAFWGLSSSWPSLPHCSNGRSLCPTGGNLARDAPSTNMTFAGRSAMRRIR